MACFQITRDGHPDLEVRSWWRSVHGSRLLTVAKSCALVANASWLFSFLVVISNERLDISANIARTLKLFPEPRVAGGPYAWTCAFFGAATAYLVASLVAQRHNWPEFAIYIYLAFDAFAVLFPCAVLAVFSYVTALGAYDFGVWFRFMAFWGPLIHLILPIPAGLLIGGLLIDALPSKEAKRVLRAASTQLLLEGRIPRFGRRFLRLAAAAAVAVVSTIVLICTHPTVIAAAGGIPMVVADATTDWKATKPSLFAHAGGREYAPENTIPAFELASAHPSVVGLESDVVLTEDWLPYLMHDCRAIGRTTDAFSIFSDQLAGRPCFEWNWPDLSKLDAGRWWDPLFTGIAIPRFAELLSIAKNNSMKVMVDLKYGDSGPYAAYVTLSLLAAADMLDGFIWLDYGMDRWDIYGPVFDRFPGATQQLAFALNALDAGSWNQTLADQRNVTVVVIPHSTTISNLRFFRNLGLSLYIYTVNEAWLFSALWISGFADAIISDEYRKLAAMEAPIHMLWSTFLNFSALSYALGISSALMLALIVQIWRRWRPPKILVIVEPETPESSISQDLPSSRNSLIRARSAVRAFEQ